MNPIKSKLQVDFLKIVIFGAGKIGRSFIGQIFGLGGYDVVFIDIDPIIVERLNNQRFYKVIYKGETEEEIIVKNVRAILASDINKLTEVVSTAGILAVSVGKNSIGEVIPGITAGLGLRFKKNPDIPLDIIIAENMTGVLSHLKKKNL
jgi:mannitol-1-phosphate 5-dehydrogenase